MFSPLLNSILPYTGALVIGLVFGLLCKAYFTGKVQNKIRGYQSDIVKCHSKILELEAKNDHLEKKLKDMQGSFAKDRLFMN